MDIRSKLPAALAVLAILAALFWHAWSYDFVCDDAFIAFRYSKHLAEHGLPVYNFEQRVEGYTSPLWMLIGAAGAWAGLPLPAWMQWVGLFSTLLMLWATWHLVMQLAMRELPPAWRPWLAVWTLALLAAFAPVAAWSMGGLEAPLFAALVTWSLYWGATLVEPERVVSAPVATAIGLLLAITTFARPEGALLFAIIGVVAFAWRAIRRQHLKPLWFYGAGFALPVAAHLGWRQHFYGDWLPNTFYVKSSGAGSGLWQRGFAYMKLAGLEIGVWWVALTVLSLIVVRRVRSPLLDMIWLWVFAMSVYVTSVGGDFLDLYRFLVPLLPAAMALVAVLVGYIGQRVGRHQSRWVVAVCGLLFVVHASWQWQIRHRSLQVAEPLRAERGIEPLGWTKLYAQLWSASGRWLRSVAHPDDWMASGAAGAMPYYAELSNVDLFGLTDKFVAKHGQVIGNRPGHQRWAPWEYTLSKRPAFIMMAEEIATEPMPLPYDPHWARQGYVWAQVRVDKHRFDAPYTFYQRLLLRKDRQFASKNLLTAKIP